MSARQPIFQPYRPHTAFAGASPWSNTLAKDTFAPQAHAPFGARPGPALGTKPRGPRIDLTTVAIKKNIPLPKGRAVPGKYNEFFKALKPKDLIECKPDEVSGIANALRKWLKDREQDKDLTVVSALATEHDPDKGGVWLWPKSEIGADTQHAKAAKAAAGVKRGARK